MKIRLTNPETVDKVLAKLDQIWPLGEYNDGFIKWCVPSIKNRLTEGETIYLESEINNTNSGICQKLFYWSAEEIPTDEEFLAEENNLQNHEQQ